MVERHGHFHEEEVGAQIVVRTVSWIILGIVVVALTVWWALT